MADPPFDEEKRQIISSAQGSTFNMVHGERSMKGFPITEDEMEAIANLNTQSQTFFSIGAFLASLAISAIWDGVFAEKLTPAGALLHHIGPWVFGVVALGFLFLGWRALVTRGNMLDRIKRQTKRGVRAHRLER